MTTVFSLHDNINTRINYCSVIAQGSEIYRIIFEIYNDQPRPTGGLIKEYEVWASETFVEDYLKLSRVPTKPEMIDFAKNYLKERFKLSGHIVPTEDGAYLTNETGEIRGNPRTFSLKNRDNKHLQRTTLMLPTETIEWLKTEGERTNNGMGEVVRRVVSAVQAGTITTKPEENTSKPEENTSQSTAGVPPQK